MAATLSSLLPGLDALSEAHEHADPVRLCAAVDAQAHAVLGHTLCTVNRYDPQRMALARVYSSNPRAYPPGGGKDKRGTPWGRQVLLERRLFIGEGIAAIQQAFDDHAAIAALGLRSVINVPVVARGLCLGTINFLMPAGQVGQDRIAAARLAGLLVVPALLALP
ncbi:GAF domain-containing protein [Bordetella genomosp. 13]|uniref:GAF domain-containing protein n=1 Tax=Bordetella genomosp. 13 TaxID=463040 RepID=UPI0021B56C23|nr:GAF domain-containing protein [Bordetella genomosp. 13]